MLPRTPSTCFQLLLHQVRVKVLASAFDAILRTSTRLPTGRVYRIQAGACQLRKPDQSQLRADNPISGVLLFPAIDQTLALTWTCQRCEKYRCDPFANLRPARNAIVV